MVTKRFIDFERGWESILLEISKLKNIHEGAPEPLFSSKEYMELYTTIYNMCNQEDSLNFSQQLYDKYKEFLEEYITSTVLPSLREKHGEFMLRELLNRWGNHQVMFRLLSRFFHYLDRFFVAVRPLQTLSEFGFTCFRDMVYREIDGIVRDAVISLIKQDRECENIDKALLKDALIFLVQIEMGQMDKYESIFEVHMLDDSAIYYSRKSSCWILEDSCEDYLYKVEECLKNEEYRALDYLPVSSKHKLLKKLQKVLLIENARLLLERCLASLRDGKMENLSAIYRLFRRIPEGLENLFNIFKEFVTSEIMTMVEQADNATINKQVFVRKVIELHERYVKHDFKDRGFFCKEVKKAIEVLGRSSVAGSSSAELLASFCDDILKEESDTYLGEDIENTTEKVVRMLFYVRDTDRFAEFYRKKLAGRLIDKSSNVDHERSILTKLKHCCGIDFISQMEGMVTDVIIE